MTETELVKSLRTLASRGWSRNHVATHLGLRFAKFKALLELLPPIDWCKPNQSALAIASRNRRRGQPRKQVEPEVRRRIVERSLEARRHYRICGVQCTIREMYDMWREYISVEYRTVGKRIQVGRGNPDFCLYDALFAPPASPQQRGKHRNSHAK